MAHEPAGWLTLLAGTVLLRSYVFIFLAAFLVLAGRDLGWRRALGWLGWGWTVAFAAEYASTRVGVPFGQFHYTGETAGRELFISNVPFFDPLSLPFLAYAAYCLARWTLGQVQGWAIITLAGALMMLLDVVIDPLAVIGDRWFLGRLFYYVEPGTYFGVPLSNFAGWLFVGWVIVGGYFVAVGRRSQVTRSPAGGVGLYYGVVLFTLGITSWIGERPLLAAGILVHVAVFLLVYGLKTVLVRGEWMGETLAGERGSVVSTTMGKGSR